MKTKLLIMSMLVISLFAFSGCTKTVDCKEALKVNFSGYSGNATAVAEYVGDEEFDSLFSISDIILDKSDKIKNGDTITVIVDVKDSILKNYNVSLKNSKFTVSAENLQEPKVITENDIFSDLEVLFTGKEGNGKIELNTDKCSQIVRNNVQFTYDILNINKLFNDDKVPITALISSKLFESGEYITDNKDYNELEDNSPYIFEKEYTVSGLYELLSSENYSKLTDTEIKKLQDGAYASIKEYTEKLADGHHVFFDDFSKENILKVFTDSAIESRPSVVKSVDNVELADTYILAGDKDSYIMFLYDITITGSTAKMPENQYSGTIVTWFNKIYIDNDGKIVEKSDMKYQEPYKDKETAYEKCIANDDLYEIIKK